MSRQAASFFSDVLRASRTFLFSSYLARLEAAPQELFVFEDSLYALKTAKNAGFHTVGIYDEAGECNQTELENEAQYYFESPLSFLSSLREGKISEFMS